MVMYMKIIIIINNIFLLQKVDFLTWMIEHFSNSKIADIK